MLVGAGRCGEVLRDAGEMLRDAGEVPGGSGRCRERRTDNKQPALCQSAASAAAAGPPGSPVPRARRSALQRLTSLLIRCQVYDGAGASGEISCRQTVLSSRHLPVSVIIVPVIARVSVMTWHAIFTRLEELRSDQQLNIRAQPSAHICAN